MKRVIVAGLINIETTCKVEQFPIEYQAVRYPFFGVRSTVSGVGFNIAKALTHLGHEVDFLSMIGTDLAESAIRQTLLNAEIADGHVISRLDETAQSVILYEGTGKRMIHVDLKDIQDTPYPLVHLDLRGADLAVLCNINFTRPMLERAKRARVPIACDVHTISNLEDEYNRDYMAHADILFMSDERLPMPPQDWARAIIARYQTRMVVIGMGAHGALLAQRDQADLVHVPARVVRPIINTIGAGDALFSAFLHGYLEHSDPVRALQSAVIFAGYKIGTAGAAEGFLNAQELAHWEQQST